MTIYKKSLRMRWAFLITLALFSLLATGCEKGSLGQKNGAIRGVVLNKTNSQPIADVLIRGSIHKSANDYYRNGMTGGDGVYLLNDCVVGEWTINWEKNGWIATHPTVNPPQVKIFAQNADTVEAPIMWMTKDPISIKGTLRGYPIDRISGSPLTNFTVTMKDPSRFKVFEMAEDFRTAGWPGLEGGNREFTITAENYKTAVATATISASPWELGVIPVSPETVSIAGTLRNLPGHVIGEDATTALANDRIWVESAGKVVASGAAQGTFQSSVIYGIPDVPVTVGAVSVKCKIRGYDVITINPSLSIPKQRPGGAIAGVDADFSNIEPIRRDVRVILLGTDPEDNNTTLKAGEIVRVYVKQGGKDIVPYVDCVGSNYMAEAYFSGIFTGYELEFLAVNQNRGFIVGRGDKIKIPEDGNSVYTLTINLAAGG